MKNCSWEMISDFQSLSEFNRFVDWINEQVSSGLAEEVPVLRPYSGLSFREKWYRHLASGQTWRLVWPEWPFTGLFERVAK